MLKSLNFKIAVCCIAFVLVLAMGIGIAFLTNDYAFADELSNNAILNFNQLLDLSNLTSASSSGISYSQSNNIITFNGNSSSTVWFNINKTFNLIANHHYYLSNSSNSEAVLHIDSASGSGLVDSGTNGNIFISNSNYNNAKLYFRVLGTYNNVKVQYMIIDLTSMFGSGNEPSTIDEVKTYLPSSYYSYNLGTPIALQNLDYQSGYDKGYSDGYNYSSTEVIYLNNLSNITGVNDGAKIVSVLNDDGSYTYTGLINQMNLLTTSDFINGQRYVISWDSIYFTNFDYVVFEIVETNGGYITFESDKSTKGEISFIYNASYPFSDLIIMFYNTNESTVSSVTINNLSVAQYSNVQSAYTNGYDLGYENGYHKGNIVGYDTGKTNGYNIGYNKGVEDASDNNFFSLMGAVVESPLNAVLGMFNFEFLGVNIKNFVMLIFTVCLIIAVVRLFMGKD